jgi:hypothetical protein
MSTPARPNDFGTNCGSGFAAMKRIAFPCAVAVGLFLSQFHASAGATWWDPDGNPANNTGITGANFDASLSITNETYLLTNSAAQMGIYSGGFSLPYAGTWETQTWTDDSSVPTSLVNPLTTFNERDDVIFWGPPLSASSSPDVAVSLTTNHAVNSLSFYTQLTANAVIYNYELFPGGGTAGGPTGNLTNLSGLINCDGGGYSYANSSSLLETRIMVPYYSTNGLQKFGSGNVQFYTNMSISGGPIICSGVTRPGAGAGITLPTAAQWNAALNGPYLPLSSASQIIITNGAIFTLSGTAITSSVPVIIWDGLFSGAGGVYAPEYIIRTCRYGNNTMAEALGDVGTGNSYLYKTGPEFFQLVALNTFKGGAVISQGGVQFTIAQGGAGSAFGTNAITLGDASTGSIDIGVMRSSTAASSTTTNLTNNLIVTTNGTGRVFIGNQAMNGMMQYSGTVALGRTAILGGSGTGVNGAYSSTAGCKFTNTISGAGGIIVEGASGIFATPAADIAAGGYSTSQNWFSGGTVWLNNANPNSYSGGSTVYWGILRATSSGSLGTGNVNVVGPGELELDNVSAISSTANLIMGTNASTPGGSNALANLNFAGTCTINALSTNGGLSYVAPGVYGPVGSSAPAANQNAIFIGTGVLNVVNPTNNSTTTLSSSPNPANVDVTFTATVAPAVSGTPTGTVTFYNGATAIGTGTLSGGVATLATTNLPAGTNSITASYGGDPNFLPSTSSALPEVVSGIQSATNVVAGITNTAPNVFQLSFQGTLGAYYSVVTTTNVALPLTSWIPVPNSTTLVTDAVAGMWGIMVTNTNSSTQQYFNAVVVP